MDQKIITAEEVNRVIKDYFKKKIDSLYVSKDNKMVNRILTYNSDLCKAIDKLFEGEQGGAEN